ncbi:MAG: hypothetical protein MPJ25_01015, partial [Pirellulales bacterium]|nr:hypothetical protein [Pirellulales bacterium]
KIMAKDKEFEEQLNKLTEGITLDQICNYPGIRQNVDLDIIFDSWNEDQERTKKMFLKLVEQVSRRRKELEKHLAKSTSQPEFANVYKEDDFIVFQTKEGEYEMPIEDILRVIHKKEEDDGNV